MKRAPRWWRRLRAWFGGYFWLPCPACGEDFGGQELHGFVRPMQVPGRPSGGKVICVLCAVERQDFLEVWFRTTGGHGVFLADRGVRHEFPFVSPSVAAAFRSRRGA